MTRSKVTAKYVNLVDRVQESPQTTRVPSGTLITISTERNSDRYEILDYSRRMNRR